MTESKLRVLIVDDEPLARKRLQSLLRDAPDVEVAGECADGGEAVAKIQELLPDLVFLDIQMPGLDGFQVLSALPQDRWPAIIFTTAHDTYALRAFELHALDYLLKPFDADRFRKALERARTDIRRARTADASARLLALLGDLKPPGGRFLERLLVKERGRVFFIKVGEVDYIEAAGNYLRIHVGRECHLLRETMNEIEEKLDPSLFLRIHRSTIVNVDRIKHMEPSISGDYVVILRDGTKLRLSRGQRARLQGLLGEL